jgi:hypothetical protein
MKSNRNKKLEGIEKHKKKGNDGFFNTIYLDFETIKKEKRNRKRKYYRYTIKCSVKNEQ